MRVALARHFDWFQNKIFTEVYIDGGIADMVFVTRSGYVTEVEIKCSLGDFKRDALKWKFSDERTLEFGPRKHIKRMYYAVPEAMLTNYLTLPEGAGLLSLTASGRIETKVEAAVNKAARKITPAQMQRWYASLHAKHWSHIIKEHYRG